MFWQSKRGYVWLVLAITLLAFLVRVYRLDGQSLWNDEQISLGRSSQPLGEMLANMPVEHPPLYFVLLHFWLPLAGTTDFALRFPSLVFGALAVPLIASLGQAAFNRQVGVLAAFLLAFNPLHVWYSQDARMYSLAVALGLAALGSILFATRSNRSSTWAGYALTAALGLYTHYYFGLILLMSGMFMIRYLRSAKKIRSFGFAGLAVILLYLPWLPRSMAVFAFPGWHDPVNLASLPARYATFYTLGTSVPADIGWQLTIGYLLLFILGLISCLVPRQKRVGDGTWLLICSLFVPATIALVMALRKPDFHERYYLVATPGLYLGIACGLAWLGRWRPGLGNRLMASIAALSWVFVVSTSVWSLSNHYFDPQYANPDYRDLTHHITQSRHSEDALVLWGPLQGLTKRYGGDDLPKTYNLLGQRYRDSSQEDIENLLSTIASKHRWVWLAVQFRDPGYVKDWFDAHGYQFEGGWRTGILLYLYAFPDVESAQEQCMDVSTRVTMQVSCTHMPRMITPNSPAYVALFWHVEDRLPVEEQVSVRLVRSTGQPVISRDLPLPHNHQTPDGLTGETGVLRVGLWIPANIMAGPYQWTALLYHSLNEQPDAEILLGDVRIESETRAGGE